jgi:Uncharacterized conserved protein
LTTLTHRFRVATRAAAAATVGALLCGGLAAGGALLSGCGSGDTNPRPASASRDFPLSALEIQTITTPRGPLRCYVMDTNAKRAEGMMYLRDFEFATGVGMIFVYNNSERRGYYGKNVILPLEVAFIAADGTVNQIKRIHPFDQTIVGSDLPAKYVLEARSPTFSDLGIQPGARLNIPDSIVAKD